MVNQTVSIRMTEVGQLLQVINMIVQLKRTTDKEATMHLQFWGSKLEEDAEQVPQLTAGSGFDIRVSDKVENYPMQMIRHLQGDASQDVHAIIDNYQNFLTFRADVDTTFHAMGKDPAAVLEIYLSIQKSEDVDEAIAEGDEGGWHGKMCIVGKEDRAVDVFIPTYYLTTLDDYAIQDGKNNLYHDDEAEVGWKSLKNPDFHFTTDLKDPGNLEELEFVRAFMDNRDPRKDLKGARYMGEQNRSRRRRKQTEEKTPAETPVETTDTEQEVEYNCLACQDSRFTTRGRPCPLCNKDGEVEAPEGDTGADTEACADPDAIEGGKVQEPSAAETSEAENQTSEPDTSEDTQQDNQQEEEPPKKSKRRTKEEVLAEKLEKAQELLEEHGYTIVLPQSDEPYDRLVEGLSNVRDDCVTMLTALDELVEQSSEDAVDMDEIRAQVKKEFLEKLQG
jgi:hypothetical protein